MLFRSLGGSAIIPSFNYERRLTDRWYGRIGGSVVVGEESDDDDVTFVFPITASWVSRPSANHHFEVGGGAGLVTGDRQDFYDNADDESFSSGFVSGIAGYRYQKPDGGFQFRAVFTPVAGGGDVLPWVGLSLGYAW